jgi:hypothetical protein
MLASIMLATAMSTVLPPELAPMFPNGVEHDFGTVRPGTQLRHAFRIVNTSNVPLQIISVRIH